MIRKHLNRFARNLSYIFAAAGISTAIYYWAIFGHYLYELDWWYATGHIFVTLAAIATFAEWFVDEDFK